VAVYHGKSGRLYLSTTGSGVAVPVANLSAWELSLATDRVETTSFGDTNKTYVQGLRDVTLTFEGYWNDADSTIFTAAQSADGCKAYAYLATTASTKYAYGPAWADVSISTGVADAVKISGSLAANGAWGFNL
jgi:hypothetical protein